MLRRRSAVAAAVAVAALALLALWASRAWHAAAAGGDPDHPASTEGPLPLATIADPVVWAWAGALQPTSIAVRAKLTAASERVRLRVVPDGPGGEGDADAWAAALASPPAAARADRGRVAALAVEGLVPDTAYRWAVEVDGELDLSRAGRFRTPAAGPSSFTVALGACASTGSNGAVFDTIRRHRPLFFLHLGDLHYENLAVADPDPYRTALDLVLTSPAQARLFLATPVVYVWDDHDFGGNDSDSTNSGRAAVARVYRESVPHYPLAETAVDGAIHQRFRVGRVCFLASDLRSRRSPRRAPDGPAKTMLGAAQRAWLEGSLAAAGGEGCALVVWASPVPWVAPVEAGADHWGGYHHERLELARFLEATPHPPLLAVSGDAHMLAIDDGSSNRYLPDGGPGFPVLQAAALDRTGSEKGGPYSHGTFPGGGQFALMTVDDDGGDVVRVEWTGRDWRDRVLVRHAMRFAAAPGAGG